MSLKAGESDPGLPSYGDVVKDEQSSTDNHGRPTIKDEVNLELWRLATFIDSTRRQKFEQAQTHDQNALELLIPEIKAFLVEFAVQVLPKATLVIIPAGVIDPSATQCDDDMKSNYEFSRVLRTDVGKLIDMQNWEEVAKRIASYLQPRQEISSGPPSKPPTEAAKKRAKSRLWSKKSTSEKSTPTAPDDSNISLPKVGMKVKAEEVVFRRQTILGLWETQRVFGLIITVVVDAERLEGQLPKCTSGFYE
jgi:hypothetical protein